MKFLVFAVMICASFCLGQDDKAAGGDANNNSKHDKNAITVQGCVSRSSGDYILIKQDPAMTYELQGSKKIKLHDYLGKRVEVTGWTSPTAMTSSDALNRMGPASSITLTASSVKTLDAECSVMPIR